MTPKVRALAMLAAAGAIGAVVGFAPGALAKATTVSADCWRPVGTSYLEWGSTATFDVAKVDNTVAAGLYYQGAQKDYNKKSGGWTLMSVRDSRYGVTGGKKWQVEGSAWVGSGPWIGNVCRVT
ncbi:hypothetical protein ACIBEJ_32010 [Nonomuraea sp. NPDC050790]|uniref:hypothetical protein n=1 Tax=Nonomuraea sp. NPDC050790 TaxID=3364371 RepID=UPI0037AD98DF